MRWLLAVLAAGCAVLVTVGSLLPGASRWMPWHAPAATHFLAYGLLGAVVAMAMRASGRAPLAALLPVAGFGVLVELAQRFVPAREASIADALLNVIGASIGVTLVVALSAALVRWRAASAQAAPRTEAGELVEEIARLASDRLLPALPMLQRRGLVSPQAAALGARALSRTPRFGNAAVGDRAVLEALDRHGVRALVLKGTLLAHTVYDAPDQRFRGDTDVLVPPQLRDAAEAALAAIGLARGWTLTAKTSDTQDQWHGTVADHPVAIDLHWQLLNHPAFVALFDFDCLWQRRQVFRLAGLEVCGLSPADALLHAALHYYAHHGDEFRPAQWLLDGDLLWRSMDPAERVEVVDRAVEQGVAGILGAFLAATEQEFATGIGADVLERLQRAGKRQWRSGILELDRRPLAAQWFLLRALPDWRARRTHVRKLLLPSPSYMRAKYPGAAGWMLPWLYVRRVWDGWRQGVGW